MNRLAELEEMVRDPACSYEILIEFANATEVRDVTPRDITPEPIELPDRASPEVLQRSRAVHEQAARQSPQNPDELVTMSVLDQLVEVIAEEMRELMAEENAFIRNELKKLRNELVAKSADERMALRATIEQKPWNDKRRPRSIQ